MLLKIGLMQQWVPNEAAYHYHRENFKEIELPDFSGGPVVKNLPANAGDMGSISSPGRSHMLRGSWVHMPQPLKPVHPKAGVRQ